jgi:hypothetical protein
MLAFLLGAVISPPANAQQAAGPEVIPVPPPEAQLPPPSSTPPEAQLPPPSSTPPATYDALDAGRDAYLRAEAQRREAIARQLAGNAYAPSHAFPLGTYLRIGPVYAYLPSAGVRAYRAYAAPIVTSPPYGAPNYATRIGAWPGLRALVSPYADRVEQPLGHVVTPTGPNGYVYRPYYKEDLPPSGAGVAAEVIPPAAVVPVNPPAPQVPAPQVVVPHEGAAPQAPVPQPPIPQPPSPAPAAANAPHAGSPAAAERVAAPQPESGPRMF